MNKKQNISRRGCIYKIESQKGNPKTAFLRLKEAKSNLVGEHVAKLFLHFVGFQAQFFAEGAAVLVDGIRFQP